jgi:plasmid maintenance system antidote protein VapI
MIEPLPTSLGATLRDHMAEKHVTQVELARLAGMSTKHVWTLLHDRVRLSVAAAHKLEIATGIPSVTWLRIDVSYRDAVERRKRRKPKPRRASILDEVEAVS